MKYYSGDLINQECTYCKKVFAYKYPGRGRAYRHLCPKCSSIVNAHIKIGTILTLVCKDCGKQFTQLSTRGRNIERCLECRPMKVGTHITSQCSICSQEFSYIFKKTYIHLCRKCYQIYSREVNTTWARQKRGNLAVGSEITVTCRDCGKSFSYLLQGRRRRLCGECFSGPNLRYLEKSNMLDMMWNLKKWAATQKAFNYACAYCGKKLKHFHRDHFIPKSRGGKSDLGNIVPACPSCNFRKHAKLPEDFLSPEKYSNVVKVLDRLINTYHSTGLLL